MGVTELKAKAKELGIKGYSKMKKAELEQAIEAAGTVGSKQVGTVNGMAIIAANGKINGKDPVAFFKSVKGYDDVTPAGARRRIRKLLRAAGHGGLASTRI